jgi:hypothetical protein
MDLFRWDEGEEGQKKVLESPMIWVRNLGDEVKVIARALGAIVLLIVTFLSQAKDK